MSIVDRYRKNTSGRDLIVGDIHGHFTKLQQALDAASFNPEVDRLFGVGDLVDRGPESDQALEWLAKQWFRTVAGNHEDMAIRWPNGNMDAQNYVANGGGWNVESTPAKQRQFADAFSALPIAIELETESGLVGIVHADCPFLHWGDFVTALKDTSVSNNKRRAVIMDAQWSRDRITGALDGDIAGVRAVVVGHTPVQRFASLDNVLYIDTGAWLPTHRGTGFFTLLDAATLAPVRAH